MPPRAAGKRKAEVDADAEVATSAVSGAGVSRAKKAKANKSAAAEDDDAADAAPKPKKAKKETAPVQPLDPSVPTNTTFPSVLLPFPRPPEGSIRLACLNLGSFKSSWAKGLKLYLEAEDADVIIMTETKVPAEPDEVALKTRYKYRYWGVDPNKKGYAGTAILTKHKPLNVTYGLPTAGDPPATVGRIITLEYPTFHLIGTYVVNAGAGLKTLDAKKAWNIAFEAYLRVLEKTGKKIVWGGDLNVAATEHDLRHAKTNWNKTPGYTEDEIEGFKSQLGNGNEKLLDFWRERHADLTGHYTYYSYRHECRQKGIGWRIDSFIGSASLLDDVQGCEIRSECYGLSDHVPVVLDLKVAMENDNGEES